MTPQPVPVIPPERQEPILEFRGGLIHDILEEMYGGHPDGEEVKAELIRRLGAGAAKYGTAWCEVDLVTDFGEEILDGLNYLAMIEARTTATGHPFPEMLLGALAETLMMVYTLLKGLPSMVGPTSKDWVLEQGLDPGEQQRKFQEELR